MNAPRASARKLSICASFSSGSIEHVEYTSSPPGRTTFAAARSSARCSALITARSLGLRRHRASGCRRKVPVPLHGTSSSTASTSATAGNRASATTASTFFAPTRAMFCASRGARAGLRSHAMTTRASRASSSALPPGAAHRSATREPGAMAAYSVTSVAPGSCTKNCPCAYAPSPVRDTPLSISRLPCTSGTCRVATPAASRIDLSCSRATPYGRSTVGGSMLFCASSAAVSAAPQRATQRATSQRGCECASASASTGSAGVGNASSPRSRSMRRSTAFARRLAPMPCRSFTSSTVCAIAAYAGTEPMCSNWSTPSRRRSTTSASSRASPPVTRGAMCASSSARRRSMPNTNSCSQRRSRASSGADARLERRIQHLAAPHVRAQLSRRAPRVGDLRERTVSRSRCGTRRHRRKDSAQRRPRHRPRPRCRGWPPCPMRRPGAGAARAQASRRRSRSRAPTCSR